MEPQFKSSFIPKKPIAPQAKPGYVARNKSSVGFFTLLTIVLFVATVLFLGGIFAYKMSLQSQIEGQVAELKKARDQFEEKFIADATRLNSRIIAANNLVQNHVSPSVIFSILEENTLKTVQFNSFSFTYGVEGLVTVSGSGVADSFRSVVLQSDAFGETQFMKNVLFSGLQPTESGDVNFSVTADIDADLFLFSNNLIPVEVEESGSDSSDIDANNDTEVDASADNESARNESNTESNNEE